MTEETIFSQTEPMRRPLLGFAFCYLAGTLGGVWINGLHFITVLAFALLVLLIAFGLHCICRLLQSKSRHRNFKDAAGPEALALPSVIDSSKPRAARGKGRVAASLAYSAVVSLLATKAGPRRPNLGIAPQYQRTIFILRFLPGFAVCFVYLAVFLAGWLAINLRFNSPSGRDISASMDRPREGIEIIGIVADDPALRKGRREGSLFWSFTMRLEALSRIGFFQKARGEILVTMPQDESEARRGKPRGIFAEPCEAKNAIPPCGKPQGFPWPTRVVSGRLAKKGEIRPSYGEPCSEAKRILQGERWYLAGTLIDKDFSSGFDVPHRMDSVRNRIPCRFLFQTDRQSEGRILLARSPSWNILHWCFILRQKCADTLARGITHRPDIVGILQALLLGRRYELPAGLREAFVATGTYHIFAISGQHVAIIAMFVVVVLQAYGICRLNWFYYLAPVLIIFTIMSGMSASAVRGCIMALMCFLAPMFKRKTDISSAMALAALLIIGIDPLQLFQAGFILSFGIVAGLIVLCPPLIAMVERKNASDPYRIEPEDLLTRNTRSALRWILFMMTASFAAWLVSTPLIAYWFNLVSLIALPANLIVIPMTTLVLLTGCLSIVSGLFCPFVAEVFNFTNVALVSLTTGITKALAQVPFGHVFVRSPPIWFVCLWLGVLIVWRIYYQKTKIWLTTVLVLLIAGVLMWRSQRNEWEIHVFNIDQCAVCLVNKAGSSSLLFNTGPRYQAHRVLRYLRKTGVNRIQAFVCPFPDAKHIGGAKDIIAALPVNRIWHGAKKQGAGFIKELCSEAEKRQIRIGEQTNGITPIGGQVWRIRSGGNGWNIDVFNGGNRVVQNKKEDLPASCPDGALTIFINAGIQTQTTARILILLRREVATKDKNGGETWLWRMKRFLIDTPMIATGRRFIGNEQTPFAMDIEESPISGFRNSERFGMPAEAQCRILCCPTVVERAQSSCGQSIDLQPPAQIVLGPGQGVLFLPGKEKKIRAINLDLSE